MTDTHLNPPDGLTPQEDDLIFRINDNIGETPNDLDDLLKMEKRVGEALEALGELRGVWEDD